MAALSHLTAQLREAVSVCSVSSKNNLSCEKIKSKPDVLCGKTHCDLPIKEIEPLSSRVISAHTGPDTGLARVNTAGRSKPFEAPPDAQVDFIDEDYTDHVPSNQSPHKEEVYFNGVTDSKANDEIAGLKNWFTPNERAFGIATTLYESHPTTKAKAGEPIADAFAICVRENSAILALADGVNWGYEACIAARSAVHGCMDYLNKALYSCGARIANTMDIFVCLLRSFSAAHSLILQENGKLTTLTVAVVAQLKNSDKFIVCSCNVGDSLAYVYSQEHGVREITQGSHDIFSMRDMRSALGALGPVDGTHPELNNLTLAMTVVEQGDIVFITSDGVSDNFDPVVGKFAIPKKSDNSQNSSEPKTDGKTNCNSNGKASEKVAKLNKLNSKPFSNRDKSSGKSCNNRTSSSASHSRRKSEGLISRISRDIKVISDKSNRQNSHNNNDVPLSSSSSKKKCDLRRNNSMPGRYNSSLPIVTAEQRHELTLLRMQDLLKNGVNAGDTRCTSAKQLCELLVEFASKLTSAKRHILEDPELYDENDESFTTSDQKQRRRKVGDKLAMVPGKLDHASVVACKVSFYGDYIKKSFDNKASSNLKLRATLAKFDSNDD